ncbi:MAG TPA: TetR/AcrR family transcriptional regulator [Thermomicrobiales bacterium]|nr:TetR/AcrR family transcriptional regulator [Thermomicrobiales bacterium]
MSLAESKPLAEVSVLDIVDEAGLNRSTYYLHYSDKESLVDEVLDGVLEIATESCRLLKESAHPGRDRFDPSWQDSLFGLIDQRPGLFAQLLSDSGNSTFGARLQQINEDTLISIWTKDDPAPESTSIPTRIRARYAAAGIQGLIVQWLEGGKIESHDVISDWVWRLAVTEHDLSKG